MTPPTEKEAARAALKAALKDKTASFRAEFTNGAGEHVAIIHVVSKELLHETMAKEVRKGRVVIVKEANGTHTAYERVVHEDQFEKKTRLKLRYSLYGSEAQSREIIKKFPWEGK